MRCASLIILNTCYKLYFSNQFVVIFSCTLKKVLKREQLLRCVDCVTFLFYLSKLTVVMTTVINKML